MVLMMLIVGALAGAIGGGILMAGSRWFTEPARDLRQLKKDHIELKKDLHKALDVLRKISGDRVGLPQLEAQMVLDELEPNNY